MGVDNKIYRTVTYEIEPSGNCVNCPSRRVLQWHTFCMAFGWTLGVPGVEQCKPCKDYLEAEKAKQENKIYCDGCFYFDVFKNGGKCGKWNPVSRDNVGDYYCINCTDREE